MLMAVLRRPSGPDTESAVNTTQKVPVLCSKSTPGASNDTLAAPLGGRRSPGALPPSPVGAPGPVAGSYLEGLRWPGLRPKNGGRGFCLEDRVESDV